VVEGKKPRMVNSEKWRPSDSSSLTAAGGAILQWTEAIPATRGTVMMIRKQNCNTQPGRRKEQRSSDSTEENGNRNENNDHLKVHLTSETGKKMERK